MDFSKAMILPKGGILSLLNKGFEDFLLSSYGILCPLVYFFSYMTCPQGGKKGF